MLGYNIYMEDDNMDEKEMKELVQQITGVTIDTSEKSIEEEVQNILGLDNMED